MKKIFISVVALAISAMTMATQTATVRINLVGSNATYSLKTLRLIEDDARSAAAENGYDAECMMTQTNSNSTLIYGLIGTTGYSTVATNDLTGLEIGFVTNQVDQDYTLTFTNFAGQEFVLFDKVTNQLITINASTPAYAFSVEPTQVGRVAINDRFVIGAPTVPSICFNYNVLEINAHAGESLVVKKGDAVIEEVASLPAVYSLDLSAQPADTRLVVILNGTAYQIDANPTTTPAN